MSSAHLILFAANLVLITTHVYGWLLKWFYKPLAYSDRFQELFPAQRAMGVIYLLQLFELPYLLQIADADALLYVNAFVLMCFSCQTLVMWEGYFFPHACWCRRCVISRCPQCLEGITCWWCLPLSPWRLPSISTIRCGWQ